MLAIVDGAHVPAHIPLDLRTLECDIYTGALHKWLCAPKGCSFLYARPEVQPLLQPLVVSWGWESDSPGASQFIDFHEWQGTRDLTPFLGAAAAIDFVESHDWHAVQAEGHRLALLTRSRIDELTGLEPISPDPGDWIGQMAAAVPLTPGGVGVVETTMTAALVAQGIPATTAAVTVLGWRLVSHWLPLAVGLGTVLIAIVIVINALAWAARRGGRF